MLQRLTAGAALLLLPFGLAAAPQDPPDAADTPPAKPGDLFGPTKVWTFHLRLTPEAWADMQPKGGGRPGPFGKGPGQPGPAPGGKGAGRGGFGLNFTYVRGTLEFGKEVYKDIGVRFKGSSSYMMAGGGLKRPFKLDFNRYVAGQKFHGLTMVSLGNNAADPSQLREALAYDVFRAAGVPAPRTAFVKLYVTVPGRYERSYAGLYTMIEAVNKGFLKRHFDTKKGLLLKPEFLRGLPYLGENWAAYKDRYRPKVGGAPAETKRLMALTKLVNSADDAAFRKEIGKLLDMEAFLRFLAANTLLANLDSFFGVGHNYYLYLNPKTNRFVFIPWDLNMALAGFPMGGSADQQAMLSISRPFLGENRLTQRLLAMEEVNRDYRAHLKRMTTTFFRTERLHAGIDAMERAVRDAVALEGKGGGRKGPRMGFGGPGPFGRAPDLKPFVAKRAESVALQLAGKSEGFVPKAFGPPGFGPGGPKGPGGFPGGFGPGNMLAGPLLKMADTKGNGKVTADEWVAAMRRLFREADRDNNGILDERELAAAINRLMPRPPFGGPPGGFGPGGPGPRPPAAAPQKGGRP